MLPSNGDESQKVTSLETLKKTQKTKKNKNAFTNKLKKPFKGYQLLRSIFSKVPSLLLGFPKYFGQLSFSHNSMIVLLYFATTMLNILATYYASVTLNCNPICRNKNSFNRSFFSVLFCSCFKLPLNNFVLHSNVVHFKLKVKNYLP